MGDPKKNKSKVERPKKPWDKARLDRERDITKNYGLVNKRELWRFETFLRHKRHNARKLLALPLEERQEREAEIVKSLNSIGLLSEKASLDDALSIGLEALLERRLQTIVFRKNLASTLKQARQFIVHGHIAINGKEVSSPNYIVKAGEEEGIDYFGEPMLLEKALEQPIKKAVEEKASEKPIKKAGEEKAVDAQTQGAE